MKRIWLELKIGLLVIVGVALVLATGYLAYTSISSIVDTIHRESKPDVKLSLIQILATDLEKAENGVRLYAYSKKKKDLAGYQYLVNNVDDQISQLREEGAENELFLANMDTISYLIERKVMVWNEMLPLYNRQQAQQYLDTISKELETKIENDSARKNRSIFRKIFQRKKKVELDEKKIVEDIEQVIDDEKQTANLIRGKEVQLARANSKLTDQLYALIHKIEEEELSLRQQRAQSADDLAAETYRWIGWFALSATLALLVVIFVISRYIKKSGLYTEALIKAKNEAENLAHTKEMFVANVSHEVRTPMNVIAGFVEQLLKKPHDKKTGETLKIIKSSSDHLVRIVNDILDFSKLESGKMKLEPVHFSPFEVFTEVKLLFENQAKEKDLILEVDVHPEIPETLLGDPIRLKQILINLLGNAIKFTIEGKISVVAYPENQVAGHVDLMVVVSDTGIGIPDDKLEHIFEDFTQAGSDTSRKFGGTGLGLSIVKKLVELHNGKISVISELKKGTEFTCRIHYLIGDINEITSLSIKDIIIPEEVQNLSFLVADDEEYNRKLIASILSKWEVSYDEAVDGDEAVELVKNKKFDLVLMDKNMPGMSGLQAANVIRNNLSDGQKKPVIVLITAASISSENLSQYKTEGIDDYLPKPFTEEALLKTILKLFRIDESRVQKVQPDVKDDDIKSDPVLDLDQLYRVAGGDDSFVIEMLEKFVQSFESGYDEMVNAIDNDDHNEAGNSAHKLASPCRHIGADKLLAILKEIETASESNNPSINYNTRAADALNEFEIVKDEINNHIRERKK